MLPPFAFFLPAPWDDRVAAVMLPNLTSQLAGRSEVAVPAASVGPWRWPPDPSR
ncbi:MAG TPA: hypothetical protein VGX25_07425 [Actinophytocola sp.]|uniref:hypothetical protein n=1 Tax=Actinophytocola sp. TaxID=1872138 RepID=UPI002DDC9321|nr:hypothetical protein [Actinophytocola sp.]HEV2779222.1 hypothetical protein [Actinophytocola sp.]